MKTSCTFSLLLLLLFAAAGCGKQAFADIEPTPFDGVTSTHPQHGFSIQAPADWDRQATDTAAALLITSPPEGDADPFQENVNVVVMDLPRPMTAEECFEGSFKTMTKVLRGFTLESSGPVTLGDVPAMAGIYTLRAGPISARMLCYIIVHGRKYYVITCTANESTFDAYKGTFSGIAKSFRLD